MEQKVLRKALGCLFYIRISPGKNSTPILVTFSKTKRDMIFTFDNLAFSNIRHQYSTVMKDDKSKKELEKKWKKTEQEEMNEEAHQLDLKEGYEQDEDYEESDE